MVKSRTSKMHLEVNNDVEFDLKNESTSKRNRKSKKPTSTRRTMKVSGLKSKALMPSIIINGKRLPVKSKSTKMSASAGAKKKAITMQSRRKPSKNDARSMKSKSASGKLVRDARGRFAEKKSSRSIRKNSSKRARSMKSKSASRKLVRDDMGRWSMKSKTASGKLIRDARGRFAQKTSSGNKKKSRSLLPKNSSKRSRSMKSKRASGKLVKEARGRFAEKKASGTKESRSLLPKNSSKRSRSRKSKSSSGKLVKDAKGRFAEKVASGTKQSGSIRKKSNMKSMIKKASGKLDGDAQKSKLGQAQAGAQQTIYMPIQQASNGETAEAIVVKNDESAKNKVDVTDVEIIEK